MDDKTEWSRFREGKNTDGPTFTVELRDVAVGHAPEYSGRERSRAATERTGTGAGNRASAGVA